jgi:hypothetical protein
VQAGRIPGGRCYGYRASEGAERGVRTIDAAEADIVRRVFREYLAGKSPLAIVAALNGDDIKGPRGGQWTSSTINGSPKRANGIISNRLYVGELVYNRQRFVKDPESGKRRSKLNPEAEWLVQPVPELAIVDRATFDAAQARRAAASCGPLSGRRRPKHILSGLVVCGCCGSSMIVVREDVLGCSAQRNKGTCYNRRTISLREIEERVIVALRHHLLAPDIVAAAVETYRLERDRLMQRRTRAAREVEREAAAIDGKIARIIRAIEDSDGEWRALLQRLKALEGERAVIQSRVPDSVPDSVLALHPRAAERYRQKVEDIHAALRKGDEAGQEAVASLRALITRIVATPELVGAPVGLTSKAI